MTNQRYQPTRSPKLCSVSTVRAAEVEDARTSAPDWNFPAQPITIRHYGRSIQTPFHTAVLHPRHTPVRCDGRPAPAGGRWDAVRHAASRQHGRHADGLAYGHHVCSTCHGDGDSSRSAVRRWSWCSHAVREHGCLRPECASKRSSSRSMCAACPIGRCCSACRSTFLAHVSSRAPASTGIVRPL